jgi:DNA helicase-2/ATP-dependent DNA helicase PcrA
VSLLEERGLHDPDGIYKAIGFVRKVDSAGIKISSYWDGFDGTKLQQSEDKYCGIIDEICSQLQQGKLYRAEPLVRKLMCRLFHYAGVKDAKTGKEHTPSSIRTTLKEKYNDIYTEHILSLVQLTDYARESVDVVVRTMIDALLNVETQENESIFNSVPAYFMEEPMTAHKVKADKNVFIEPLRGRRIQFDTVHGVKGETHEATLYLETELNRGTDIGRVLCCYGVGQAGSSPLYDYSRKIVYVGMSRPRKLLCVAVQESTYRKSKDVFLKWDKADLRRSKGEET